MQREVPLIKEYRIHKILKRSLVCFEEHLYDREKQKECVLKLYDTDGTRDIKHWDKSIFRGMVIPSLKYLGLIYGDSDTLNVSANGKIIVESEKRNDKFHNQILRTIVYELDNKTFQFFSKFGKAKLLTKNNFIQNIKEEIQGDSDKQKIERINKWLSILNEVELISLSKFIVVNEKNRVEAKKNIQVQKKELDLFNGILISSYKNIAKGNAGIIKIEEIRKNVCSSFCEKSIILTEAKFDALLRKTPFDTKKYLFSFGKPMGAQEKLFEYNGINYSTLHIKFY